MCINNVRKTLIIYRLFYSTIIMQNYQILNVYNIKFPLFIYWEGIKMSLVRWLNNYLPFGVGTNCTCIVEKCRKLDIPTALIFKEPQISMKSNTVNSRNRNDNIFPQKNSVTIKIAFSLFSLNQSKFKSKIKGFC